MAVIYIILLFLGLIGAYGTKLSGNNNFFGYILVIMTGIISSSLWIWVSKTQKNILLLNSIWDAVYALSWLFGIYLFVDNKVNFHQLIGMILILIGIYVVNL